MALSLASLITPVTRQQSLDTLLGFLTDLGFATTSWQSGSAQRTIVTACAWIYADGTTAVANIAKGGFRTLAKGDWLDLVGEGSFEDERVAAISTVGLVTLTHAGGAPHAWGVDELLLSDTPDGSSGILYRNTTAGGITGGTTIEEEFRAVTPGRRANIASAPSPGVTMYLLTPLANVTAAVISDPTTGTWVTTSGEDRESDPRYAERMGTRWGTLTYGSGELAYRRWALEADPTVTRVTVLQGATPANVRVICATSSGGITGGQIAAITAYIEDGRRPINDVVSVESANVVSVDVVAEPVVRRGTATVGSIQEALNTYFADLPIGGRVIFPAVPGSGAVVYEELVETILALEGVRRARLSDPTADVALGATDVAVPVYDITITEVSTGDQP